MPAVPHQSACAKDEATSQGPCGAPSCTYLSCILSSTDMRLRVWSWGGLTTGPLHRWTRKLWRWRLAQEAWGSEFPARAQHVKGPEVGRDRLDGSGGPQLCMCLLHPLQPPCQGNTLQ